MVFLPTQSAKKPLPNICDRSALRTIHATCEDYRAGASIDLMHDDADLQRKISCPVLALWAERGAMHRQYNILDTWKERAANASGKPLPSSHFIAEEIPEMLLSELGNSLG